MRSLPVVAIVAGQLLLVSVHSGISSDQSSGPKVEELLPRDGIEVDLMEVVAPARYVALGKKFQEAVQKDRDWFLSHVKKTKPGEPLPYDPRLGLTKAEYEDFLKFGDKASLQKVKGVTLRVTKRGNRYALDGGKDLPELRGVEIDLDQDLITTPYGKTTERADITASEDQKVTGPWNGLEWKLESIDLKTMQGLVVRFDLGRLEKTGRGILYYDVKELTADAKKRVTYVLFYDLTASK